MMHAFVEDGASGEMPPALILPLEGGWNHTASDPGEVPAAETSSLFDGERGAGGAAFSAAADDPRQMMLPFDGYARGD